MPHPSLPSWLIEGPRFEPGTVSISVAAQDAIRGVRITVESLLSRHCSGDFGELSEADKQICEANIAAGGHVTSVYSVPRFPLGLGREQIWVCSLLREKWTYVCVQSEIGNVL